MRRSLVYNINHKTVQCLIKTLGLQGKQQRSKYRSYKDDVGKVAPNELNRNFKVAESFEKLVTDVTEFDIDDEKVYLSPIFDLYNSKIVSYSISLHPNFAQTREILTGVFSKMPT